MMPKALTTEELERGHEAAKTNGLAEWKNAIAGFFTEEEREKVVADMVINCYLL